MSHYLRQYLDHLGTMTSLKSLSALPSRHKSKRVDPGQVLSNHVLSWFTSLLRVLLFFSIRTRERCLESRKRQNTIVFVQLFRVVTQILDDDSCCLSGSGAVRLAKKGCTLQLVFIKLVHMKHALH